MHSIIFSTCTLNLSCYKCKKIIYIDINYRNKIKKKLKCFECIKKLIEKRF